MAKPKKPSKPKTAPFPSRDEILDFILKNPQRVGKREIARAFRLDSRQRIALKDVLRDLENEGLIGRQRGRRYTPPKALPPVAVVEITGTDVDGELLARPSNWEDAAAPPKIFMAPERKGHTALGIGERILARLTRLDEDTYEGRMIRRLQEAPRQVLGVFRAGPSEDPAGTGRLQPTNKRQRQEFIVAKENFRDAVPGDLVLAEILPGKPFGLRHAKIVERIDRLEGTKSISLIALHEHDVPIEIDPQALKEAKAATAAPLQDREDLRDLPLVTIDGEDARDFDDAVWAEPDSDPKNPDGWHIIVAIADVAWYVRPGSALDAAAYQRGNSVYLPDKVVPMLPEALSNGWCSLKPKEDRPCLIAHLWINAHGHLQRHKFARAMMRSAARLTYEQAQAAHDGRPDEATRPLHDAVIAPLYGAYRALAEARRQRGVLELDLPEHQIVFDETGTVAGVRLRARHDSHRLIEEFMIAANVAAAKTLEAQKLPCMYRIHDEPSLEKLEALRSLLDGIGIRLAKGQVLKPAHFNQILARAADTEYAHMVNETVLRTQSQAEYNPKNIGHFGLALRRYCHFTSPIRRYSDLLVHRALIRGGRFGDGGLEQDHRDFAEMGEHISMTERRASAAERDAVDRFSAAFLADKIGAQFLARINGVTRFGLFVTLMDSNADALVPIRTLPEDYYFHDEAHHLLRGRHSGRIYRLGDTVDVTLVEADPISGSLLCHILDSGTPSSRKGKSPSRKTKPPGQRRVNRKPRKKGGPKN
ncbi:MAG: ribonuclease R [Rhodospirillales bacterium]